MYLGNHTKALTKRYGIDEDIAKVLVEDLVQNFIVEPCLDELSGLGTKKVYHLISNGFDKNTPYPGEMTEWHGEPLSVAQIAHILRALAQDHAEDVKEARAEDEAMTQIEMVENESGSILYRYKGR